MKPEYTTIKNNGIEIPATLCGKSCSKMLIAVHGDLSNKEDTVIKLLAEVAVSRDYQVLSFDLPEHGERKNDAYKNNPKNCVSDLLAIYDYARQSKLEIYLFACSIGAYLSLLAYHNLPIQKSLFLSPVVNMERIMQNMMSGFQVGEQRLQAEKRISLPIGKTLDWDYYSYVKQHPINFNWTIPTFILYGDQDVVSERNEVEYFTREYQAMLTVVDSEHYFYSKKQLSFFETWLQANL